MNASQRAQNGYQHHAQAAKTTRDTEYDAFARITSRLKAAASKGRSAYNELAEALHENRKLWTILAADVASKSNSLSPDIRARIFFLSEFTQKHSSLVLRKEASVRPLLEINIAIMRGLRQSIATPQTTRNEGLQTSTLHAQGREPERTGGISP